METTKVEEVFQVIDAELNYVYPLTSSLEKTLRSISSRRISSTSEQTTAPSVSSALRVAERVSSSSRRHLIESCIWN